MMEEMILERKSSLESDRNSLLAKIDRATDEAVRLRAQVEALETPKVAKLGSVIKSYRQLNGLDQRTVAAEIGIGAATLMRIEKGHSTDATTWLKLQRWLLGDG